MMEPVEEQLLSMLPQIRDPAKLAELAEVLGLVVHSEVRGNWKHLYRMMSMHLTSSEFEDQENHVEVMETMARLCKYHLGIFDMRSFGRVGADVDPGPRRSDTAGQGGAVSGVDTSADLDGLVNRGLRSGLHGEFGSGGRDEEDAVFGGRRPSVPVSRSGNVGVSMSPPRLLYNPPRGAPQPDNHFRPLHSTHPVDQSTGFRAPVYSFESGTLNQPGVSRPDVRFHSSAAVPSVHSPQPLLNDHGLPLGGASIGGQSASLNGAATGGYHLPQPFPYATPVYPSNNPFSPFHPSNVQNTPQANLLQQYPLSAQTLAGPSHAYTGPTNYGSSVGPTVIRTKELKLNGQIGEPGEAGKLNYGSLFYQISAAKTRKYPPEEIISAVIKAITPNLSLRNHLERKRGLTLESMLASLRGHFLLTSATKTFTAMGNLVQKPGQREISYCHEVMAMRDDVLALSEEEGGDYTVKLVQNHLQHVLSVGFSKSGVRQEMRSFLKTPSLEDQEILEHLRDIVVDEKEHEDLRSASSAAAPAVNVVAAGGDAATDLLLDRLEHLTKKLEDLSTLPDKVDKLDKDLKRQQRPNPGGGFGGGGGQNQRGGGFGGGNGGGNGPGNGGGNQNGGGVRYRNLAGGLQCLKCQQVGDGGRWDHCFNCCGTGHQMAHCTKN